MSPRPPQSPAADNRHTYIPPSVQQAMSQHMQQSMPAHLQQYAKAGGGAYVPQRVQQELTAHMQKTMPAHLQQYAGAYVQQNVVDPSLRSSAGYRTVTAAAPPPKSHLNQTHSGNINAAQRDAQFLNLFQADTPPEQQPSYPPAQPGQQPQMGSYGPQLPEQNYGPQESYDTNQPYDFIMNPGAPKRRPGLSLPGSSKASRLAILGGVVVVFIILLSIVTSFLNRPSFNTTAMVSIAQEQAELVRVAGIGTVNAVDTPAQNTAYNVQLSVTSAEQQLAKYLATNHYKLSTKTVALKRNPQTDTQLKNAQAASVFDSEFLSIMQAQLTAYQKSLKSAYEANPGPKGRQLLSDEYTSAGLLLEQSQQH